jgi:hypothetical protein
MVNYTTASVCFAVVNCIRHLQPHLGFNVFMMATSDCGILDVRNMLSHSSGINVQGKELLGFQD